MNDMADVLVVHQRQNASSCLCGWSELGKSHPAHQAASLSAAGVGPVREAQEGAWERCIDHVLVSCTYVTATAALWRHKRLISDLNEVKAANPYREDT